MWEKARNWGLGLVLFLGSLAAGVTFAQKRRGAKAQDRVNEGKVDDATQAERKRMNAGELAAVKETIARIPLQSVARTPDETEAELRRRGLVK